MPLASARQPPFIRYETHGPQADDSVPFMRNSADLQLAQTHRADAAVRVRRDTLAPRNDVAE